MNFAKFISHKIECYFCNYYLEKINRDVIGCPFENRHTQLGYCKITISALALQLICNDNYYLFIQYDSYLEKDKSEIYTMNGNHINFVPRYSINISFEDFLLKKCKLQSKIDNVLIINNIHKKII